VSVPEIQPSLDAKGLRVGLVQSRFNLPICQGLTNACVAELLALGVADTDVLLVTVPGALEIPVMLQKMAASDQFDALVALGAVIRGETYHFELVCNESAAGLSRVALDAAIPIANAILTTDTDAQAEARMEEKGRDAARAAIEMANLAETLEDLAREDDDAVFG
jgi:6,7-dimethyl-8-ribityllumazine synthase